jgi:hypothetical protein
MKRNNNQNNLKKEVGRISCFLELLHSYYNGICGVLVHGLMIQDRETEKQTQLIRSTDFFFFYKGAGVNQWEMSLSQQIVLFWSN